MATTEKVRHQRELKKLKGEIVTYLTNLRDLINRHFYLPAKLGGNQKARWVSNQMMEDIDEKIGRYTL